MFLYFLEENVNEYWLCRNANSSSVNCEKNDFFRVNTIEKFYHKIEVKNNFLKSCDYFCFWPCKRQNEWTQKAKKIIIEWYAKKSLFLTTKTLRNFFWISEENNISENDQKSLFLTTKALKNLSWISKENNISEND